MRIPAIAISPWIPAQTVINAEYRNTSVITTLRNRWQLGAPLTGRDAVAADLAPVLTLDTPRDPAGWPEARPQPVPPYTGLIPAPDAALHGLAKAAFHAALALAEHRGTVVPVITRDENVARADCVALLNDLADDALFLRLRRD